MSDNYIPAALKRAVYTRAQDCCEYCRNQAKYVGPFDFDHVWPLSKTGVTSFDNLAYSCAVCNSYKSNLVEGTDPDSKEIVALFNPRIHLWKEHFAWSADTTQVFGLTAIGRATVAALRLNRLEAINLRRILFAVGEHPPQL